MSMRPDSSPSPLVPLYRGEPVPDESLIAAWIRQSPTFRTIEAASGRWFTRSLEDARWYAREAGPGRVLALRLPFTDLLRYSALRSTTARRYVSKRKVAAGIDDEYFLPRDLAAQAGVIELIDAATTSTAA